jgi:catechol 2,3-dioxygenase-like lactoylglutathione lyase family enzyme
MPTTTAQVQQIANIVVPVADVDAAIDFYTASVSNSISADFRAAIQPPSRRFASEASGVLVAQGAAVEPGGGEGLGQVGLAQDG